MITELKVYQKTYDLYLYTHKFIKKFPKAERFLLSHVLQNSLMEAIKLMVRANLEDNPMLRIQDQNQVQEWLAVYGTALRLTTDLNFLSQKKYAYAASLTEEITRILIGWKKSGYVKV